MKRPGLLLAVFIVALLGWITLNSVATETAGSDGLQAGDALPPFAMPLSTSSCRGRCDANVATKAGQGAAGAKPACPVRGPDVLNSCELAEGGPFVLAFVFNPVARCRAQVPLLERAARAPPRDRVPRRGRARRRGDRARAGLDPAGRIRPRRGGGQRVRGRGLPDDHLRARAAGRSPARRSGRSASRRSRAGCSALARCAGHDRATFSPGLGLGGARSRSAQPAAALAAAPCAGSLNALSDRHGGARAITQRTREIPQAYRAHYGDERSPAEELTIKRLIRGQYRSRGVLRDALLIATIDTEVGVWALDADRHTGPPRLAGREIVDDDGPLAPLFEDPRSVNRATRRITLYAITRRASPTSPSRRRCSPPRRSALPHSVASDARAGAARRSAPALVAAVAHEELAAARGVAVGERRGGEKLDRRVRRAGEQLVERIGLGGRDQRDRAVAQLRDERHRRQRGVDALLDPDRRRLAAAAASSRAKIASRSSRTSSRRMSAACSVGSGTRLASCSAQARRSAPLASSSV